MPFLNEWEQYREMRLYSQESPSQSLPKKARACTDTHMHARTRSYSQHGAIRSDGYILLELQNFEYRVINYNTVISNSGGRIDCDLTL